MKVYIIRRKSRSGNFEDIPHIYEKKKDAINFLINEMIIKMNYYLDKPYLNLDKNKNSLENFWVITTKGEIIAQQAKTIVEKANMKYSSYKILSECQNFWYYAFYKRDKEAKRFKEAYKMLCDVRQGKEKVFKTKFLDYYMFPYETE